MMTLIKNCRLFTIIIDNRVFFRAIMNMSTSVIDNTFKITSLGLIIEGQPTQEDWFRFGRSLANRRDSVHWIIGDWLNYGIDHYNFTYTKAAQILNEHGFMFTNQTLRIDKYVAARIPLLWRHNELSWQHHKEVASLKPDEQKYWLSYASEMYITTKELRDAIKGCVKHKWLKISDVWDFESFDENFGIGTTEDIERIPGQIIQNLLFYYSKPNAFVIDPLGYDGTTFDICTKCNQLKRNCFTFDIEPFQQKVLRADATKPWPVHQLADFIFINATRFSILRFNQEFGITLRKILGQAVYNLKFSGVIAVLIEPHTADEKEKDWSFEVFRWLKYEMNLKYERRITLPIPSYYVEPKKKADAIKNNELVPRTLDLMVFRKCQVKKCYRCGILIHEKSDREDHKLNGKIFCTVCRQEIQFINPNEKNNRLCTLPAQ
jgi:hypothetical protein